MKDRKIRYKNLWNLMPLKMPQMQGAKEPEKRSVLPVREHFQATEQRRRWGIFSGIREAC